MQYKTIILELLQDRTQLHQQLCQTKQLLPMVERLAKELKESHEQLKKTLATANPNSDPGQIAAEAMELAMAEMQERLTMLSPSPSA